jgi:hypothetical protein
MYPTYGTSLTIVSTEICCIPLVLGYLVRITKFATRRRPRSMNPTALKENKLNKLLIEFRKKALPYTPRKPIRPREDVVEKQWKEHRSQWSPLINTI